LAFFMKRLLGSVTLVCLEALFLDSSCAIWRRPEAGGNSSKHILLLAIL
jgi:hypothetical protein